MGIKDDDGDDDGDHDYDDGGSGCRDDGEYILVSMMMVYKASID